MASVFITYRRSDSSSATGRIADRLQSHFGSNHVFYDITAIPLGVDFRAFISNQLDKTDIFLVIIGDNWLEAKDKNGYRRLDNPEDWVRIEVAAALARENIPVIPVLVGKATKPPKMEDLPDDIASLSSRNCLVLRSDSTFEGQIDRLIKYIDGHLEQLDRIAENEGEQLLVGNDKDKVLMQTKPLKNTNNNYIRFSLSTAYDIKWWKAIKVFDKRGMISLLSTQDDDHGPKQSPLISALDFADNIKIEFYKAKMFGKHDRVDRIELPTSQMKGSEVSFTWLTDS